MRQVRSTIPWGVALLAIYCASIAIAQDSGALDLDALEEESRDEIIIDDAVVTLRREVELAASEPGMVREVHVEDGAVVDEGHVLLTLDDSRLKAEAEAARQSVEIARVATENDVDLRYARKAESVAKADLCRAEHARRVFDKSVSQSELDQLRLVMERSGLAAEQAERDLHAAQLRAELEDARAEVTAIRLKNLKVVAPFAGMVVQLQKQPGAWLALGEPMARLIQLDRLRVEGFIDGRKYDPSIAASSAMMTVTLPSGQERGFRGEITFVSSELHPISGLIRVRADIDNPDLQLRPGMRGTLKIDAAQ